MRIYIGIISLAAALAAVPASAEVKSSGPTGFEVEASAAVPTSPADTFAAFGRIGEWWSSDHTYSGNAANLALGLRAGDCLCEHLPDGGTVEHLRIVQARPGALLRASGGLGPLQGEAVAATLSWTLRAVEGGTEIRQNYLVSGAIRGGAEKWAPLVDAMLAEQLERLRRHLE